MIGRFVLGFACSLLLVGCGSQGPTTYRLRGAVTFDGQPAAVGRIDLVPDASRGNSAMAGFASIKNGTYDTAAGGIGSVGGPMIVTVAGSLPQSPAGDTANARETVFEHTFTAELPREASTLDVGVPPSAGREVQRSGPSP
jgi:hypothetical protein